MAEGYSSIKVKDLNRMVQYYQDQFNAELLDQTDTSALMLLGDTVFEFVMGFSPSMSSLTIEWDHYKGFKEMMVNLELQENIHNHYHRASIKDIEGNLITFLYYEMVIPSQVLVEKID